MKADFDPIDKIKAAYFYHVLGLTQAQITAVLNISNNGRTNEAIKEIEAVVGLSNGGYKANRGHVLTKDDVLAVACDCGATPGQSCVSYTGNKKTSFHSARYTAARALKNEASNDR